LIKNKIIDSSYKVIRGSCWWRWK